MRRALVVSRKLLTIPRRGYDFRGDHRKVADIGNTAPGFADKWLDENKATHKGVDVSEPGKYRVYCGGGRFYTRRCDEIMYTIMHDGKEVLHNDDNDPAFISPTILEWRQLGEYYGPGIRRPWWGSGFTTAYDNVAFWLFYRGESYSRKDYSRIFINMREPRDGVLLERWEATVKGNQVLNSTFYSREGGKKIGSIYFEYENDEVYLAKYVDMDSKLHRWNGPAFTKKHAPSGGLPKSHIGRIMVLNSKNMDINQNVMVSSAFGRGSIFTAVKMGSLNGQKLWKPAKLLVQKS